MMSTIHNHKLARNAIKPLQPIKPMVGEILTHSLSIYGCQEYKLFFFTLYLWTAAFVFSLVISYYDFIVSFSPSS
jgi:hypothetical protein